MIEFNQALLAKQVWHLIEFHESLMTQILKARYFKNMNIMDAPIGLRPSFIWQSILRSRKLLAKRLQRRMGDGRNISAFKDAWISGLCSGKSSVNVGASQDVKVGNFIGLVGTWKTTTLQADFPLFEVKALLNIPIHTRGSTDRRYCK